MRGGRITRRYRWALPLALVVLLYPRVAPALGFGELQSGSTLGEPLSARIVLVSVPPEVRSSLSVSIAGQTLYQRLGLKRPAAAGRIDIDVLERASSARRVVLQLSSRQPIDSPLLELLVVAQTARGRYVRRYTVLLDPAGAPLATRTLEQARSPVVSRPATPAYGPVRPGETLWAIARAHRYDSVSVDQMVAAIYQANPDAFAGGVGHLRVDSTLTLPSRRVVQAVTPDAARQLLSRSRSRRLERLVASVQARHGDLLARLARMHDEASGSVPAPGRLRLVTPRYDMPWWSPRGTKTMTTTDAARGASGEQGDAFGRLVPVSTAVPAGTAHALETARQPSTSTFALDIMSVGQLTGAPRMPARHVAPAVDAKPQATHAADVTLTAPSAQARDAGTTALDARVGRLRVLLWVVVAVCLLLALALWVQTRRLKPALVPLAGLTEPGEDTGTG